jgi:hypothetical protein
VNHSHISATDLRSDEVYMKAAEEIGTLCRVVSARMPIKWGMFNAAGRDLNLINRRADYVNH